MHELPTGTVTLLFTDMAGSTRLLQLLGKRYADVLAECRDLMRAAFHQHHGHEIDTQGDAFFVAFARASDADLSRGDCPTCSRWPLLARRGSGSGSHGPAHGRTRSGLGRLCRSERASRGPHYERWAWGAGAALSSDVRLSGARLTREGKPARPGSTSPQRSETPPSSVPTGHCGPCR